MKGITKDVIEVISDVVTLDKNVKVNLDDSLVDGLGYDELDIVQLVMALEERFGVSIDDEEAEKWRLVRDVIEYMGKEKE